MLVRSSLLSVLSVLGLVSCREAPSPSAEKLLLVSPSVIASAEPKPASPPAKIALPEPEPARIPLGERLAREAASRPERSLRSEALIEALAMRGIDVAPARQVLARPIGALYCEAAVSQQGMALSLCAYPNARAALAGSARSHELFDRIVPGRTLIARGSTLLTLAPSAAAAGEVALASTLFAELTP